jgi:K+-transporting ATPase ATPase C chain
MSTLTSRLGQYGPAVRLMIVATIALGLAYPLAITGIGRVAFHSQADGSLIERGGSTVGSSLIGQSFLGRAKYFQSRPSAAGTGYDALSSGASNLALDNSTLVHQVEQRRAADAKFDGVAPASVPADALLASGSGLDPQISPAYAAEQVRRVARVRELSTATVTALVTRYTQGRTLGFLGEPRVNVLELNLALDRAATSAH